MCFSLFLALSLSLNAKRKTQAKAHLRHSMDAKEATEAKAQGKAQERADATMEQHLKLLHSKPAMLKAGCYSQAKLN